MRKEILIVEDDAKNMRLFRDILQFKGYSILEATDGRQGVDLAKEHKPDLILMDIQLPVMDGIEATRIIKSDESCKNIRVVALTASVMTGDREKIMEAGCDGYISKPIDIKEFLSTIEKYFQTAEVTHEGRK